MKKQNFDLSIVLPLCKPKPGWAGVLAQNMETLQGLLPYTSIQFIVVNDGFETTELLSLFNLLNETFCNLKVISYTPNMGKGFALRTGVNAAVAPYTITTDSDFPYCNENIVAMYKALLNGADIVAGVRSGNYYATVPLTRRIISKGCILLNRLMLHLPYCDTQSGLKGFNAIGKHLFLSTSINRFLIDTEFLMMGYRKKFGIALLELQLKPGIRFSAMGVKVLLTELWNLYRLVQCRDTLARLNKKAYYEATDNLPYVRSGRV